MIDYDQQGELTIDGCRAGSLAQQFGTPLFVYSTAQLQRNCAVYADLISEVGVSSHYAVKANSNLALLALIKQAGLGFDVVSGGELDRCLRIGAEPSGIVYSGVGKSKAELKQAVAAGIGCINIECEGEGERIIRLAADLDAGKRVRLAIRVNPDIAVDTHPYIATSLASSKFGVPLARTPELAKRLADAPGCDLVGLGCHLGSMLEEIAPVVESCRQLVALAGRLRPTTEIAHLSLGGGLAVRYRDENQPGAQELLDACAPMLRGSGLSLMLEPGRSVIASAGLMLTSVEYCKTNEARNFAIVDAAMNDLPRPALYNAWHKIIPARRSKKLVKAREQVWDVVGPVCESGDFIGKDRPLALEEGDLLAVLTTGAYCASMASNYNCRPRAAEVLARDGEARLIAARQSNEQMLASELAVCDATR